MKVLVFEDNLMWSSKLLQSLRGLGHEGIVMREIPTEVPGIGAVIVNLGQSVPPPGEIVAAMKTLGVPVIAHAGHREKELMELGREAGADILATNSELTFKIEDLLTKATTQQD